MASPFAVFRRNQKVLLAVVGVLAMIAFVFLDPVMRYAGRDTTQTNKVVVESKYGKLRQSDLQNMVATRKLVDSFIQAVVFADVFSGAQPGMNDQFLQQQVASMYRHIKQELMERVSQNAEAAAVETMLLAKKAEQMNIKVSNTAINNYLKRITSDSVRPELDSIIKKLGGNRGEVSQVQLFDAIRTEMMASAVSRMFEMGLLSIPPAAQWDYYTRLNRRATAEAVTLDVEQFLDQVGQPSEQEVQDFFEKFKERLEIAGSPEPGFKQPRRADFQYFKIDYETLVAQADPQVTDDEIKNYYEQNKDLQFRTLKLPKEDEKQDDDPADDKAKDDEAKGDDADSDTTAEESAAKEPKDDAPAADKSEGSPATPDAKKGASSNPKPAAGAPPSKPGAKSPAVGKPKGASLRPPRTKWLLTSGPKKPTADENSKPTPEPGDADAEKEAAPEREEKDAAQAEGTEPAAKASESPKVGTEQEPASPPQYDSLEKVKDDIRKTLAREKANAKMTEIMARLGSEMRRAASTAKVANKAAGDDQTPTLDFAKLAESEGVKVGRTGLVSADDLRDSDIGKSYEDVENRSSGSLERHRFADLAFSRDRFAATVTTDNDQNRYIFWKAEATEENVPKLEQVRKKVIQTWRVVQARKAAFAKAEEYANQARKAGGSLKEVFEKEEGVKVEVIGPFTWMSLGSAPFMPGADIPRVSDVEKIDEAGEAFMETVFRLPPGGIGVAMNQPRTAAYVIRLIDFNPAAEDLRKDFAKENYMKYRQLGALRVQQRYRTWMDNLQSEARVVWERAPEANE